MPWFRGYNEKISIHALREEGDFSFADGAHLLHGISIHALREEGDCPWAFTTRVSVNFNPRPPRGGRLLRSVRQDVRNDISIHALREEGDS